MFCRMTQPVGGVSRRAVLGGFAAAWATSFPQLAPAAERMAVALEARAESLPLFPGRSPSRVWQLAGGGSVLRLARGSALDLAFANGLSVPAALSVRGLAMPTPLLMQQPVGPGGRTTIVAASPRAGTGLLDLRLLADAAAAPNRPLPLIVDEATAVTIDRDEVFLVEDFRLKPDGKAIAPGADPKDSELLYTVNGQLQPEVALRAQARVRLRFINGCHRAVIAIKIAELGDVRVMAIDSQPAEPFLARNGAVVLPPGGRTDVFIDMPAAKAPLQVLLHDGTSARPVARLTLANEPPLRAAPLPLPAPLPANGLPDKLDLRSAVRAELALDGPDWRPPAQFNAGSAPAFRAKPGRVVVLALANKTAGATVVHLHGQPFRLLDRLDDGWKPYWLDTLAVEAGQTQRIAFLAEQSGRSLIESMATNWAAPRLVRWYEIG
ncbi:multicopper oxidase domain-containing protein [Bradyrhizobium sp. 83012]|uniref:Multicopper oxidase domain-containing protein n=1 Tax=Bradyrhizobium aeschynomenes TaxID=2734909 RepID=A0ABX2C8P6_9BRAD|nr:multicopper oxidase domain-containing protein [Bradyrhizobium aeschynomenes]NPU64623.1 multicopper oxidase domain-containing protein [Bradyrhizobium aeschynomenes]